MSIQALETDRGAGDGCRIDFAIYDDSSLLIFLPVSPAAEEHALEAFGAAMIWGSGYVVEPRYAGSIIADLFARGFRLTLDGRRIVPAGRARQ